MTVTLIRWALPASGDEGMEEMVVADVRAPAREREIADVIIGGGDDEPARLLHAFPGCLAAVRPQAAGVLAIRDRRGRAITAYGALSPAVCGSFAHLVCSGLVVRGNPPEACTYLVHLRRLHPDEERERLLELTTCGRRVAERFPCVGPGQVGAGFLEHGPRGARHLLCLVQRGQRAPRLPGQDVRLG